MIGGKAVGLVRLHAIGENVPTAYFLNCYSSELLQVLDKNKRYAVRSSADVEDGNKNAFAGIFDSVLNIKSCQLEKAIKKVLLSTNSKRAQDYFRCNNITQEPKMHLIVQEFISPQFAGVWMGDKSNSKRGVLEYVDGCGEALVSGQKTPKRYLYNESNNHVEKLIAIIAQKMLEIQKKMESVLDIEWCYFKKSIYLLQARQVTSEIFTIFEPFDNLKSDFKGSAGSAGLVSGQPVLLNSKEEYVLPNEDEILLTWFTDPEWIPIMKNYKGVITSVGGFLSHAAITCREMNIPCIVGVDKQDMLRIVSHKKIQMDGSSGIVKILEE